MSFLFGSDESDEDEQRTEQRTQTTENAPPQFVQAPEYAEATGARSLWSNKLNEWANQPGYGAIAPDWADIWNQAQSKVNRYYWGGPSEGGGLVGKIKANAAARNASGSPAIEENIRQMGMGQGDQLSTMATEEAKNKASFSETGRQNWLTSLMSLSQQKPQVASYSPGSTTTMTQPSSNQGIFGSLMGLAGSYLGQQSNQNWMTSLLKGMGGGGGGGGGSSDFALPENISNEPDWASIGLTAAQVLPMFL